MIPSDFIDFINNKVRLPEEAKQDVLKEIAEIAVPKNHFLLKQGMIPHHVWYIVEGSIRVFYEHDDKEVTSWIYNEGQPVTAFGCFFSQVPSYDYIQCTEDCKLVRISYDSLQTLYKIHPKMQEFGRLWMEEMVYILDNFFKGFMFMSAKEKYDLLLSYFPDVTQRVNLGHIASFLGISQETLSRVRNKT